MPDVSGGGDLWSLLVPVKRLDLAKTRLALDDGPRADLALAMALDTVSAAISAEAVAEVVVISDDERAGAALTAIGARVISDLPNAGLNPALVHGATLAAMQRVAALSSDLPALRSADLDTVLREAAKHPLAVVADQVGTGTTLLAARVAEGFEPAFGVNSLAAHVRAGAVDLSGAAAASIRQDVDTVDALRVAVKLGVGVETTRTLATLNLAIP
jgi:2-phospho-L-lactate guanylyltransferase